MNLELRDKAVVITGASGGIGRALAEAFLDEGARCVLHGNTRAAELEQRVVERGWQERTSVVAADLTEPGALDSAMGEAVERWGRIDAVIANAGYWHPEHDLLHAASPERIRHGVAANLLSSAWTARSFFATLERTGPREDGHGASLVFTGSTAGRFGEAGHAEYAMAKAGLVGLALSLKNEIVRLDPYGRVNVIEPGWTVTEMAREELDRPGAIAGVARTMPLRQLARAADIARTALYLASPAMSRHVSGEVVTVAGGMEGRVQWSADEIDEAEVRRRLGDGSV